MNTQRRQPNHVQAEWELYWMVFYDQSRIETFRRMVHKWGITPRTAAEMIRDCEQARAREG